MAANDWPALQIRMTLSLAFLAPALADRGSASASSA